MKISLNNFKEAVKNIRNVKILVIGDIILDEYLIGEVNRISPEAPVPVLLVRNEQLNLGGAGNVINNLTALGCKSVVYGRCGQDKYSELLNNLLKHKNLTENDIHLTHSDGIPTTIKTRIIAGHQQICRVDREETTPLTTQEQISIIASLEKDIKDSHGMILSDYDKGYFNAGFIESIVKLTTTNNCFVAVDPQISHFNLYKQVSILTPNHHEAGNFLGKKLISDKEVEDGAIEICAKLNSDLMITRGDKGMTIYEKESGKITHIPTVAKEVFDVTGAGDTVISVYTAFKLSGLNEIESALVANAAASVVISRLGAATASIAEIENKLNEMDLFY